MHRTTTAPPGANKKRPGCLAAAGPCIFGAAALLERSQVHRRGLAAPVDLELELETVALIEAGHAGPLDRRDVNERIRLAVVAADESEALHCIEELDRAGSLLAGQLALRSAAAIAEAAARAA